jgi:hypothetical protein
MQSQMRVQAGVRTRARRPLLRQLVERQAKLGLAPVFTLS